MHVFSCTQFPCMSNIIFITFLPCVSMLFELCRPLNMNFNALQSQTNKKKNTFFMRFLYGFKSNLIKKVNVVEILNRIKIPYIMVTPQ